MSDVADEAMIRERLYLRVALANATTRCNAQPSALFCEECGGPIPEARRRAVPGCRLCRDCQEGAE